MTPILPLLALAAAGPPAAPAEASADASLPGARAEAPAEALRTPSRPATPPDPIAAHLPWAAPRALPTTSPAPPLPWPAIPVARALHPVGHHYGRRYQSLLGSIVGGPRASPVFGPTVAEADVHWRLLDATGRGLDLDPAAAERWRDMALAASFLATERLVDETVERAPTLYGVYVAGDTLMSPSFDLRKKGPEEIEVVHRPGGPTARALERAEEELALGRPRGRPTPALGVGLDWELRDAEAPESAPLVQYAAWLSATELGLTSLRVELAPASLAWNVSGRQLLVPRLFLIGTARSVDLGPDPGRLSGGLMWVPPLPGSCNVRAERILALEEDDDRWMLSLRCENRTPAPAPLVPPLGDRGRGGPALPWAPERDPIPVAPWTPTSTSEATR